MSFLIAGFLPAGGQVYFSEVALAAGITDQKTVWTVGNGVSFVDFDGDGLDDITIGTQKDEPIAFFRNEGGSFVRLPSLVDHADEAKQVLWLDYDNDGDKDFFVATFEGLNRLYQNQGGLKLVDVTMAAGLPDEDQYAYGACWADFDRDGFLDLYFGNHKDLIPDKYNVLLRNKGDGTFEDVSFETNALDYGKIPFCSAFLDFNNDNWPDIYTANDKLTRNTLLMNQRGERFVDVGAVTKANVRMNAMCVAVGDYDNDGWQDVYVTNTPVGNALLRNLGYHELFNYVEFEEVAAQSGVGYFGNGWGANFLDADNDGHLDLYVNGSSQIASAGNRSSLFYLNQGDGTFTIPDAGFEADTAHSYSNAIGDFNMDGYPDILVQNNPPNHHYLWQNHGGESSWIKVKLTGVLSNRDAVAAKIEVYAEDTYQMRFRHCGIGFMGQNSDTEIVGLGQHEMVDSIVVTWPTGHQDRLYDISPNQALFITEGSTTNGIINVDPGIDLLTTETAQISWLENEFTVHPNPVYDQVRITSKSMDSGYFRIFGLDGKVWKRGAIPASEFIVDVSSFPGSLFFLVLTDTDGRSQGKRLVKVGAGR